MLTFEQVFTIFYDYLEEDRDVEVVMTKRGHLRILWAGKYPYCDESTLCETPEELFDCLINDCKGYYEAMITKGRRELTSEDREQAMAKASRFIEKRREVESI